MTSLAWANVWHRKLRSSLAALAVAIGVAMLVTMLALSHGTLEEVAHRVQTIDADLVVLPPKSSLIYSHGATLSHKYEAKLIDVTVGAKPLVKRVVPVFLAVVQDMAGQQQRVFGIRTDDFDVFLGDRHVVEGSVFPHLAPFERAIDALRNSKGRYDPDRVSPELVDQACEMVIDRRLARAGKYHLGDTVSFLGSDFRICAIVEAGLAGRVFVPIEVLRYIQGAGTPWSSVFFVQVNPDIVGDGTGGKLTLAQAAERLGTAVALRIEPLENYEQMLFHSFHSIYVYINIASAIVLIVSFLFIMVTIYTMVLERRREIGILRSLGAAGGYIMRQTVLEAVTISAVGTAGGLALSGLAKWVIEYYRPLLTVDIRVKWLVLAVAVGLLGGLISALYPGYRALREDPVECLGYE